MNVHQHRRLFELVQKKQTTTRMLSSRMRTISGCLREGGCVCPEGCLPGGGCRPGGVSAQGGGGVCLVGLSAWGCLSGGGASTQREGVCSGGMCLPREILTQGGVCLGGCLPEGRVSARHPPCEQNHRQV